MEVHYPPEVTDGVWLPNSKLHAAMNCYGRTYWAPPTSKHASLFGTYNGVWPTPTGARPTGLMWLVSAQEGAPSGGAYFKKVAGPTEAPPHHAARAFFDVLPEKPQPTVTHVPLAHKLSGKNSLYDASSGLSNEELVDQIADTLKRRPNLTYEDAIRLQTVVGDLVWDRT